MCDKGELYLGFSLLNRVILLGLGLSMNLEEVEGQERKINQM